jgi:hypothetical protein
MEINKYTDIIGVITRQAIVEGRMVILTDNNSADHDFGSRSDLPGVRVPASTTEAARAHYIVTWPVNNANSEGEIVWLKTIPSMSYSLRRGGWDQAANVPFSATVYLTYPGNQESVEIPSGYLALAFARGVFTIPSGQYVYSADIMNPGAPLEVLNSGDDGADAGKLAYNASGTIAVVERYDSSDGSLTFRTY